MFPRYTGADVFGRMPQKVLRWEWTGRKKRWRGKCMSEEGTPQVLGEIGDYFVAMKLVGLMTAALTWGALTMSL